MISRVRVPAKWLEKTTTIDMIGHELFGLLTKDHPQFRDHYRITVHFVRAVGAASWTPFRQSRLRITNAGRQNKKCIEVSWDAEWLGSVFGR